VANVALADTFNDEDEEVRKDGTMMSRRIQSKSLMFIKGIII